MKKLFCFLLLTFFLFTAIGCNATDKNQVTTVNQTNSGKDFECSENLTLEEVTKTIAEAGIELIEIPGAGQTLRLNEVTPSVFSVNRTDETMLIYVCPSIGIRKLITPDTFGYEYMPLHDRDYLPILKQCKNVLIIDQVPLARFAKLGYFAGPYDLDRWSRLDEAALKLNDAQVTLLCGSSAHWEGKLTVKHYFYWYRDEDGTMRYENNQKDTYNIRYLGPPNEVNEVAYSIKYPGGSRSSTNHPLTQGCLQLSSSGGVFDDSDVYDITLKWNGQKESFQLKAVQRQQ